MRLKLRRLTKPLHRKRRGITGLETSIILIAFIVVASVFAYTVLTAGIFTSQKNQEALQTGIRQARSTMKLTSAIIAYGNSSNAVTSLQFTIGNALDGYPIDLTPPYDDAEGNGTGNGLADSDSQHVTTISYHSDSAVALDLDYSIAHGGMSDSDDLLEAGEKFDVTVDLTGVGEPILRYSSFKLEIKPPIGSTLTIEKTMPAQIDPIQILW